MALAASVATTRPSRSTDTVSAIASTSSDAVGYASREAAGAGPLLIVDLTQNLVPIVEITAPETGTTVPSGTALKRRASAAAAPSPPDRP